MHAHIALCMLCFVLGYLSGMRLVDQDTGSIYHHALIELEAMRDGKLQVRRLCLVPQYLGVCIEGEGLFCNCLIHIVRYVVSWQSIHLQELQSAKQALNRRSRRQSPENGIMNMGDEIKDESSTLLSPRAEVAQFPCRKIADSRRKKELPVYVFVAGIEGSGRFYQYELLRVYVTYSFLKKTFLPTYIN